MTTFAVFGYTLIHIAACPVTGSYICIGGSNQRVLLYSWEGLLLGPLAQLDASIVAIAAHPLHDNALAVVCGNGSVTMVQIQYEAVHGFHKERYAYR